jgi:hypothetical protein
LKALAGLFESGHIIDLILLLVLLETLALWWLLKRADTRLRLTQLLPNLVAGAALLLALRSALAGADWLWTALALSLALVAHITDLQQRWREGRA